MKKYDVVHKPAINSFVVVVDGFTAHAEYRITPYGFDIIHTIVPVPIRGRGVAKELVETAYAYAESCGYALLGSCSYAKLWLMRNKKL